MCSLSYKYNSFSFFLLYLVCFLYAHFMFYETRFWRHAQESRENSIFNIVVILNYSQRIIELWKICGIWYESLFSVVFRTLPNIYACSLCSNLISVVSRVLIGPYLIFCSPTWRTSCNLPQKWKANSWISILLIDNPYDRNVCKNSKRLKAIIVRIPLLMFNRVLNTLLLKT